MYFNYTLFKLYVYANIFFIAQVWFWGRGQLVFWGATKFLNLLAPRATASTSIMSRPVRQAPRMTSQPNSDFHAELGLGSETIIGNLYLSWPKLLNTF